MSIFGLKLDLGPSFGAYLVGTLVTNVLLGATCVQTYIYLRKYEDRLLIRSAVLTLLVLELVHAALSMHVVYHYLINNYLNPLGLLTDVWSVNIGFLFTGMIVLLVQLAYATRIYYVSDRKLLVPIIVSILASTDFALAITLTTILFKHPLIASMVGAPDKLAQSILITGAFVDVLVAGVLSYYLNKARTGIKSTDKIIDRLMKYAINNGILTSIVHITSAVLVFTHPQDLYSLALSQIVGNLYSNSLMATLNSRPRRKGTSRASESASEVMTSTTLSFHAASGNVTASANGRRTATPMRSVGSTRTKSYGQGLGGIQVQIESLAESNEDSESV